MTKIMSSYQYIHVLDRNTMIYSHSGILRYHWWKVDEISHVNVPELKAMLARIKI